VSAHKGYRLTSHRRRVYVEKSRLTKLAIGSESRQPVTLDYMARYMLSGLSFNDSLRAGGWRGFAQKVAKNAFVTEERSWLAPTPASSSRQSVPSGPTWHEAAADEDGAGSRIQAVLICSPPARQGPRSRARQAPRSSLAGRCSALAFERPALARSLSDARLTRVWTFAPQSVIRSMEDRPLS